MRQYMPTYSNNNKPLTIKTITRAHEVWEKEERNLALQYLIHKRYYDELNFFVAQMNVREWTESYE